MFEGLHVAPGGVLAVGSDSRGGESNLLAHSVGDETSDIAGLFVFLMIRGREWGLVVAAAEHVMPFDW